MAFYNSFPAFLYRQAFITPPAPPASVNLTGKAGLVTGSNIGLGYEASAQLLSLGLSRLILAVRNVPKGKKARESLLAAYRVCQKAPTVEVWELDMCSYESIARFTDRLKRSGIRLDFAILNAGVLPSEFNINAGTGNEETIQTNWLSTALLTLLLLPEMDKMARNNSRPVLSIVNSEAAGWAKFKKAKAVTSNHGQEKEKEVSLRNTLNDPSTFAISDRYSTSKLLYQLFFVELTQRRSAAKQSTGTIINIVNPGFCRETEMHRSITGVLGKIVKLLKWIFSRSVALGARTLVHGAVWAGPESDGKYLSDCAPAPFADCVDTSWGRIMRTRVWDKSIDEIGKVSDVESILKDI